MPGGDTTTQTQQQSSSTAPWLPAQPLLSGILGKLGGANTDPNPTQLAGVNALTSAATNAPDFGPAATNVTNSLLTGGPSDYSGILNGGYDAYKKSLDPFASGSMVGKNDALKDQLSTIGNDVYNSVSSNFAGAGRSLSPGAIQAIARGTAQGEAPVIAGQYNTDVSNQLNSAGNLFSASGTTASGLTGLAQTKLGNQQAGLTAAAGMPGILNAQGNSLLAAGNAAQALPLQGTQLLESLGIPIASLGAQSTGTSTGETTKQTSPISNILGAGIGGLGLLGGTGAFGSAGWLAPLLMSDERTKEDIEPIGILNDGSSNIYRFKYKGDPSRRTHIGLLAQEVESFAPDAVKEIGGIKFVNYERATEHAAA